MHKERGAQRKVNQECYALLFKALLKEPQTLDNLEDVSGLHRVTLYDLFRILKKHKVVHISGWEQDSRGRDVFPVFTLGAGRDKPRYKMSAAERQARYKQRKKAHAEQIALNNLLAGGTHAVLRDTPTSPPA